MVAPCGRDQSSGTRMLPHLTVGTSAQSVQVMAGLAPPAAATPTAADERVDGVAVAASVAIVAATTIATATAVDQRILIVLPPRTGSKEPPVQGGPPRPSRG